MFFFLCLFRLWSLRYCLSLSGITLWFGFLPTFADASNTSREINSISGEFLIKVKSAEQLEMMGKELNIHVVPSPLLVTLSGLWFKVFDGTGQFSQRELSSAGVRFGVLHVEPNFLWRALEPKKESNREFNQVDPSPEQPPRLSRRPRVDPLLGRLWSFEKVDAYAAWKNVIGSDEVVVANIDTGVDYNHEDLINNIWRNPGEVPNDGRDNDRNGFVDDVLGWDFVNNDNRPWDDNGHGTHTAGTTGATGGNGRGISGISQRVRLIPLKFLSRSGSGTTENAIRAINYAVDAGAHILSNSWGGENYSLALEEAITEAGAQNILFVAAAGNDSTDNDSVPMYPASYRLPNVISVAASDSTDRLAEFSNYGVSTVDIAAPGDVIFSTVPSDRYYVMSGTSMACPLVAGAAALLKAYKRSLNPIQMKNLLLLSVDKGAAFEDKIISGGRLNVSKALDIASGELD